MANAALPAARAVLGLSSPPAIRSEPLPPPSVLAPSSQAPSTQAPSAQGGTQAPAPAAVAMPPKTP
ncbi:MAG: DUF2147 domain-containing protein, partial [Xanthobacteraceae bacterium]